MKAEIFGFFFKCLNLMKILNFFEILEILKFLENFEIL
jgi:hypothetical protein